MMTDHIHVMTLGMILFLFSHLIALGDTGQDSGIINQTSEHFVFWSHQEDHLYIEPIIEQAERLWSKITEDIGSAPPQQIRVIMAFTHGEFNQFQQDDHPLPDWATGVAYPAKFLMVIRSPRLVEGYQEDTLQVFTHELTHLILGHRFGDHPIPRWLNEGLSMYESYEWHPSQDFLMAKYVLSGQLVPLQDLSHAFEADPFEVRQAYLQSYSLVNYMISTYGREPFHQFIKRLSQGEPFDQAIEQVFRVSSPEFEAHWMRHLRVRYTWIPLLTSSTALWLLIIAVLAGAYIQRKIRAQSILEQWAEEEGTSSNPQTQYQPSKRDPDE